MGVSLTALTTLTGPDDHAGLRGRLIAMRTALVERMARDRIEAGTLALLAGIAAAIDVTEAAAERSDFAAEGRAIRAVDGASITLTLYRETEAAASVTVAPRRAVALAGELIAAALPRLAAR